MQRLGDIRLGETLDFKFPTRRADTQAPHTLAGTPAIAAYVGNSTTEIIAGLTLIVDFDGRTGCNHVRVVATSGNGFVAESDVQIVLTAGTVNGVSVANEPIAHFSIEKRSALMPTVAGRKLDVAATGEAGLDFSNYLISGACAPLAIADEGTAVSATASTIVLRAALSWANDIPNGGFIYIYEGTGVGQARMIDDFTGATDTVNISPPWTETPDATSKYIAFRTPPASSGSLPDVNVAKVGGTVQSGGDLVAFLTGIDNLLDTEMAAVLAAVDTEVAAIKVVTDMLNAAQTAPTGVPAVNAAPIIKLAWLYKALINGFHATTTKKQFKNDAGAAEWEKDLTGDETFYTESAANAA